MVETRVDRRLAAILAADVVGYSRLIGADEEGTLARINDLRRDFWEPKIAEHRGRIVRWIGDGVLIEFASVVGAARCAFEIQSGMDERNSAGPQTNVSSCASASTLAISSSTVTTFLVMASTSLHDWKGSRIRRCLFLSCSLRTS